MIYAGIGSRDTPANILKWMENFAAQMAADGHILRSGAAPGADQAFGRGASLIHPEHVEVFLPNADFGVYQEGNRVFAPPSTEAFEYINQFHPNPKALRAFPRALMARNTHQILGETIGQSPITDFVVMWAPDTGRYGSTVWAEDGSVLDCPGGTGQAVRIAASKAIPVYHAGLPEHREFLEKEFACSF